MMIKFGFPLAIATSVVTLSIQDGVITPTLSLKLSMKGKDPNGIRIILQSVEPAMEKLDLELAGNFVYLRDVKGDVHDDTQGNGNAHSTSPIPSPVYRSKFTEGYAARNLAQKIKLGLGPLRSALTGLRNGVGRALSGWPYATTTESRAHPLIPEAAAVEREDSTPTDTASSSATTATSTNVEPVQNDRRRKAKDPMDVIEDIKLNLNQFGFTVNFRIGSRDKFNVPIISIKHIMREEGGPPVPLSEQQKEVETQINNFFLTYAKTRPSKQSQVLDSWWQAHTRMVDDVFVPKRRNSSSI